MVGLRAVIGLSEHDAESEAGCACGAVLGRCYQELSRIRSWRRFTRDFSRRRSDEKAE